VTARQSRVGSARGAGVHRARPAAGPPREFSVRHAGPRSTLFDTKNGKRALVINAIGRVFMTPFDDPFAVLNRELEACQLRSARMPSWSISIARRQAKSRASDFSATAAPQPRGRHPHPCADCRHQILSGGTAYMTDAGMTGDYDSIIGMQKEEPLRRFTTGIPSGRFEPRWAHHAERRRGRDR